MLIIYFLKSWKASTFTKIPDLKFPCATKKKKNCPLTGENISGKWSFQLLKMFQKCGWEVNSLKLSISALNHASLWSWISHYFNRPCGCYKLLHSTETLLNQKQIMNWFHDWNQNQWNLYIRINPLKSSISDIANNLIKWLKLFSRQLTQKLTGKNFFSRNNFWHLDLYTYHRISLTKTPNNKIQNKSTRVSFTAYKPQSIYTE